ncbi:YdeI/OmpD-associated family protein [Galbibacter pacificus]|uniref:YdeI/OmpD-associated family protein n=1 Tax=Galbibacter pacificus TaxID=2996052 RepID=A0ABT6FRF6_9FLAO|nr:YdeI/OmpD-associated family protein [Galbibacter pacificus]MDG3581671.1 YdeI/OmpD-associated family protein [Galbibacter pacificus]MDG3585855.1 YdeI/OmpD-associated family protein [Galbibacter pacificus]
MLVFKATIEIIGINPFVHVPEAILTEIFKQAGKNKGPVPIRGTINRKKYVQTLVKYKGDWRFYVNTAMLKNSPKRIGETVEITIEYDPSDRTIKPHPKLLEALNKDKNAQKVFTGLPPSLQKEIVRYIASLKTEEIIQRNIKRAINFLNGKERFIGRDKP